MCISFAKFSITGLGRDIPAVVDADERENKWNGRTKVRGAISELQNYPKSSAKL